MCNEVRNRLMHGDSLEEIETSSGIEFPKIVDNIGQVAWWALRSVIRIELASMGKETCVEFLQTNTFCQIIGVVHTLAVYTPHDPANPRIGEWPEPTIEIQRSSNNGGI